MGDFSLGGSALFAGVENEELGPLLQKVGARERSFQRGETLLTAGERARSMGLVMAGRVTVEHHDFWGSRSVLDSLGPGKVFAEAYALLPEEPLQVSVTGAGAVSRSRQTGPGPPPAAEPAAPHRGEEPAPVPAHLPHLL